MGDALVKHVTDDGNFQPFNLAFVFADGERVEQRLGGMFVRPVAGVDDGRVAHSRKMCRRASHRVTHDDAVRRHGFEVARGIQQRLALADAGGGDADVDGVGGEPFGCDFEGSTSARGRLEKEIDNCAPTKRRHLFDFAAGDVAKRFRSVEQMRDFACFEFADAEKMFSSKNWVHSSHWVFGFGFCFGSWYLELCTLNVKPKGSKHQAQSSKFQRKNQSKAKDHFMIQKSGHRWPLLLNPLLREVARRLLPLLPRRIPEAS